MRPELAAHLAGASAGYPIDAAKAAEILSYILIPGLLYWQMKKRLVKIRLWRPVALLLLGSLDLAYHAMRHPISGRDALLLAASIVLLGIGLGLVRAYTIRLWQEDSIVFRQGTMLTAILWLTAVGLHLTADHFASIGSASLLLYLGVTIAVQRLAMRYRVAQMQPAPASAANRR